MDITKKEIRASSVTVSPLPDQTISREVLLEKYAKGTESSIDDVRARVARALAAVEPEDKRALWEKRFLQAMEDGFIPAGRINSAAGTDAGDADQLLRAAGRRFDLRNRRRQARHLHRATAGGRDHAPRRRRRLRLLVASGPKGADVKGTQSRATGPVSYMRVFDRSCETVESAGSRRGAQMGVLRCDHPDIEEFIHAKDGGDLTNFNISVGVTDAFMQAVEADGEVELAHKAEPRKRRRRPPALTSATTACGSIASCRRASCGTRSCARPTITPSRASCSSTA